MRHTVVFETDDIPPKMFGTETPFGKAVLSSLGDLAAQCDILREALEEIDRRGGTSISIGVIVQNALALARFDTTKNLKEAERRARPHIHGEAARQTETMLAALEQAQAIMSIVEPRSSDKAEYLRILGVVREAIAAAKGGAGRQAGGAA